jgi:hypothetical protein
MKEKKLTEKTRALFRNARELHVEKSAKTNFDFSSYIQNKPSHVKECDISFLEWFIGFTEGDGCFSVHYDYPTFIINQAETQVLSHIRTKLGFGSVYTYDQEGSTYARYWVKDKQGIFRLLCLFNGNIHLEKVHKNFKKWLEQANKKFGWNLSLKPRRNPTLISLQNAWLSGFFDADGSCYANATETNRMNHGFRLRLKAFIDQKFEYTVLQQIANLLKSFSIRVRNKKKTYFRVEFVSKESLALIVKYLDTYKLRSKKKNTFAIWRRLVNNYLDSSYLTMDPVLLKRRIQRVKNSNQIFKQTRNVNLQFPRDPNGSPREGAHEPGACRHPGP